MRTEKLRVAIGINSLTESQWPAYNSHLQLFYRLGRDNPDLELILINPSRLSIDSMRNLTAAITVKEKLDYLLFLDDDVLPPPDCLNRLIAANVDVIAGDVIIRGWPFDHMAFKYGDTQKSYMKAISKYDSIGLHPVDAVGFSLCLIKRELIEKVDTPYFITGLNHTEDVYFCIKARAVDPNCSIVVDNTIICGHILWPEIISANNKEDYRDYYEKQNPEVLTKPNETKFAVERVPDGTTYEAVVKEEMRRRGIE